MSNSTQCCDTSCPEPVDQVTIVNNSLDPDNALTITLSNSGGATGTTTASFQVVDEDGDDVAGNFSINWRIVDVNDKTAEPTVLPPTAPGAAEGNVRTDATGLKTLAMSSTNALDEWYIVGEFIGVLYIAGPINLGT